MKKGILVDENDEILGENTDLVFPLLNIKISKIFQANLLLYNKIGYKQDS